MSINWIGCFGYHRLWIFPSSVRKAILLPINLIITVLAISMCLWTRSNKVIDGRPSIVSTFASSSKSLNSSFWVWPFPWEAVPKSLSFHDISRSFELSTCIPFLSTIGSSRSSGSICHWRTFLVDRPRLSSKFENIKNIYHSFKMFYKKKWDIVSKVFRFYK